jgi:hypothetical protein
MRKKGAEKHIMKEQSMNRKQNLFSGFAVMWTLPMARPQSF